MRTARSVLKKIDKIAESGPFSASWDSLLKHRVPEWYKDAKFGIFIHWGVYSVPAFGGEWYPRHMYEKGHPTFQHHLNTWGPHDKFGYKDFIPLFKAKNFNAKEWAKLFKEAGAKYVVPVAEHHDGFPMYDCSFTKWNSVLMGPKRDIARELGDAIKNCGMRLGLSSHRAEHSWFMNHGRSIKSDVNDPKYQDFYGPAKPCLNHNTFERGGDSEPSDAFLDDWLARTCEIVDKYRPEIIWFDWWIKHHAFKEHLKKFGAYYYNRMAEWGLEGAINHKGDDFPEGCGVFDIERGQTAEIRPLLWQNDTAVSKNAWGYITHNEYKTPASIIHDLVDLVSKNGVLLLNIGPKADGTIPEEDKNILLSIGKWLKHNGEAIYDTRPWLVFGEGPTQIVPGAFNDVKRSPFTSQDIRFTCKNNKLYATFMAWPENGMLLIKSLAEDSHFRPTPIRSVKLLGKHSPLKWHRDASGLSVFLPDVAPCQFAWSLLIE